jgi:hypothetical protein
MLFRIGNDYVYRYEDALSTRQTCSIYHHLY